MSCYFSKKLNMIDSQQLESILKLIDNLQYEINHSLTYLKQSIISKTNKLLLESQTYNQLERVESQYINFNDRHSSINLIEIIQNLQNFTKISNNELKHLHPENLQLLYFQNSIKKLKELRSNFNFTMKFINGLIEQNHKTQTNQNQNKISNDEILEIWKYKQLAKSGNNFVSQTFSKNFGIAESILPLQDLLFKGIYLTKLFSGVNQFDQQIDNTNINISLILRVHEGINLAQSIYEEEIQINHQNQKLIQDCYFIELNEKIYLKLGFTYTITLVSQIDKEYHLFLYQGKSVNFQSAIKFLNKEVETIPQVLNVKANHVQSCIAGLIFEK